MGSKIKKIGKSIGGVAGKVVDPLNLTKGKASALFGGAGLEDLLMGKKTGGISKDAIAGQIRGAQAQGIATATTGLGALNKALDAKGGEQVVREGFARQQQGLVTAAQDARRKAQQLIAQRGLGSSSLGLRAERSAQQQLGQQNAALQAQMPGAIRNQLLQDAQTRMQAGSGLFGSLGGTTGIRFQSQPGQRSGGLLGTAAALAPLAGTIAGGAFGGPGGAAIGGQLGGSLSGALKSQQTGYLPQGQAYA